MSSVTQLTPTPVFRAADNNGNPLVNGQLYTYAAGTTTPQATYTDSTGGTANTNPIVLNARGEANVWLTPTLNYKMQLQDSLGNTIWTVDNINGASSGANSILPNTTNTYNIGSSSYVWANGYFTNLYTTNLYSDGAAGITVQGPATGPTLTVNAPLSGSGLTVYGVTGTYTAGFIGTAGICVYDATTYYQGKLYYNSGTSAFRVGAYASGGYGLEFTTTTTSGSETVRMNLNTAGAITMYAPSSGNVTLTVNGVSGTHSMQIADSAGNLWNAGYLGLPNNSQSSAYTLALSDRGKCVISSTGANITVPNSVFSTGDAVTIFNNYTSSITIAAGIGTLYFAGTSSTGARTLNQRGICTVYFVSSTVAVISGSGLS